MSSTEQRKLAAIMFTDMVGYSSMAQGDDELALSLLEEHRALLRGIFPNFHGQEIKTIGDAFLIEFGSALEAAQCGIEMQRALSKRNHDVSAERRIELKIGIHIGDVVHRGGDVYGDGVNIASRIEPLAGAGGICISMDVERQIRNALEARFEKLGPTDLKNIKLPMELFRIILPWEAGGVTHVVGKKSTTAKPPFFAFASVGLAGAVILGWWLVYRPGSGAKIEPVPPATPTPAATMAMPAAAPDPKSIAVLPFANMSEDKENAFFADGIHEDILTTLAVVRDLKVVSRTSVAQYRNTTKPIGQIAQELGVAYVLEGSVRRAGNKVRVTGQLIRAATDEHVWAKSYDRDLNDIFAIQSELATEIAGSLQSALSPQEKSLIDRRPTDNLAAYDDYLKARRDVQADFKLAEAETLLEQAVSLDPKFAEAWAELSSTHAKFWFSDLDVSAERQAKAKGAIDTAVRLEPDSPQVIEKLGDYYYYGFRDYAHAAEQYQRLTVLRPNDASAYTMLGLMHRRQGLWEQALQEMRRGRELAPRDIFCLNNLQDLVLNGLHRYEEARALSKPLLELEPDNLLQQAYQTSISFSANGSTQEFDDWLAQVKPTPEQKSLVLFLRQACAVLESNYSEAIRINREQRYYDGFSNPHCLQDLNIAFVLAASGDIAAAQRRAEEALSGAKSLLEKQPSNATLWMSAGQANALLGNKVEALRCSQRAKELMPESKDTVAGVAVSFGCAQTLAWVGEKNQALAELARILRTPYGGNVHAIRVDPFWLPMRGDARFEALLNDPLNNALLPRASMD